MSRAARTGRGAARGEAPSGGGKAGRDGARSGELDDVDGSDGEDVEAGDEDGDEFEARADDEADSDDGDTEADDEDGSDEYEPEADDEDGSDDQGDSDEFAAEADDEDGSDDEDDRGDADGGGEDGHDPRDGSDGELGARAGADDEDGEDVQVDDEDGSDDEFDQDGDDEDGDDDDAFATADAPPGGWGGAEDMSFASGPGRVRFTVAPRRKVPRWFVQALARRVARAARRLKVGGAAVTIHLVDDPAIAELNAQHMGKVGPTDVLSFPAGPLGPGVDAAGGDVVISVDAVRRQARARLGISDMAAGTGLKRQVLWGLVIETGPKTPVLPDMVQGSAEASAAVDEATVLAVHGLCHLLGHDHGRSGEARAMHRAERRALRAADTPDVPRPYGIDARRERRARRTR